MKTKDSSKELTKLQTQILQAIADCDLSDSINAITSLRGNYDMDWLDARIKNMQLKQRILKNTLQQLLETGEALVEEYKKKHGDDRRIAIQDQVILEPARIKLKELDARLSDLRNLRKVVRIAKEQNTKIQETILLSMLKRRE